MDPFIPLFLLPAAIAAIASSLIKSKYNYRHLLSQIAAVSSLPSLGAKGPQSAIPLHSVSSLKRIPDPQSNDGRSPACGYNNHGSHDNGFVPACYRIMHVNH